MTVTTSERTSYEQPGATAPPTAPIPPHTMRSARRELTLNLPCVRIQIRPPELHLPRVELPHITPRELGHAIDIARTFLPPPERMLYYGGLAAIAAFGVIDWPIAAAIGAGTMIAQRARAREQRWSPLRAPRETASEPTEPARRTRTTTGTTTTTTRRTRATKRTTA